MVAQADDPSAVYYNPAGITQLDGTQVAGGTLFFFPQNEFEGAGGRETSSAPAYLPHFFAVTDLGTDRLRLGLAINNVFGASQEWGNEGQLRSIITHAELYVVNIAPTLALRLGDHLSIGASLNAEYGSFDLHTRPDLAPGVVGTSQLNGDGWGFGGTIGLHYRIDDHNSVGVVYRSPFRIEMDGEGIIKGPGVQVGPSDATTTFDFPQIVRLGYAFRPVEQWTIEADIEWTGWSSVRHVPVNSGNPRFDAVDIPLDWTDGLSFGLGTEWRVTRHWALRAGYQYWANSVPTSTFGPIVPDANLNVFAAGIGYDAGRWALDIGYEFLLKADREISGSVNSPAVDGDWHSNASAVVVTFTWRF